MRAAVLRAYGQPLAVEDVELARPVRASCACARVACGICHSDLHVQKGTLPAPLPTRARPRGGRHRRGGGRRGQRT